MTCSRTIPAEVPGFSAYGGYHAYGHEHVTPFDPEALKAGLPGVYDAAAGRQGDAALRGMAPATRPHFVTTVHGLYSVSAYSAVMTRGERIIAVSRHARDYILAKKGPDNVLKLPKINHPKLVNVMANPGIADYPGEAS